MTPSRFELKPLLEFLKREFREKRPKGIDLVLVKQRAILTRGVLPDFQIRAYPGSRHLVVEDLGVEYRVYFFAENGIIAGGVNVPTDSPWLVKLWKGSRVLYHLPKKVPEVRPEQAAETEYQRYKKVYTPLASLWGARPDPPLLLIVPFPSYPQTGLEFGVAEITGKKEVEGSSTRRISLEAIQSPNGPFILARETFRLFVTEAACFPSTHETDILVNYLASIYCGPSCRDIFDRVWGDLTAISEGSNISALEELLSRLPAALQKKPKQAVEKYIRAVASAAALLGKIGEKLPPAAVILFVKTLIIDFLEGQGGRNERILVHYYADALEEGRNAKDSPQADLGEVAVKAVLAHACFAHDLKLGTPPDIAGIGGHPFLNAAITLLEGKFQPFLTALTRNADQYPAPVQTLARMAITSQIRDKGFSIDVGEIAHLLVNNPATVEVHLHNSTDIPLLNVEVDVSPQPTGRLQVGDLQREGPVDFHNTLLFRCSVTGLTTGSATLEIRARVDHPCPHEKRIVLVSRVPITIT